MTIRAGLRLLRDRYLLVGERIHSGERSESWVGVTVEGDDPYLIRLWPYSGDEPPELQRALWDAELRTLYRVGSTPGAEETILIIRDAGLDRAAQCFVMVLEARHSNGYTPLSSALIKRNAFSWLRNTETQGRREIWSGLRRLAEGIALLHEQHVLHRNVEAEYVFFHPDLGTESLRLGGFEWSIRVGVPDKLPPPTIWSSPPEFFSGSYGYSRETDWYAFGMLVVRCLCSVETFASMNALERHQRVMREIERAPAAHLYDIEKQCLSRLIALDPNERLANSHDIQTLIGEIIEGLATQSERARERISLVLAVNPSTQRLIENLLENGFRPNPNETDEPFNPGDPSHVAQMTHFIQSDINRAQPSAQLYATRNKGLFLLVGDKLILTITAFSFTNRQTNEIEQTWNFAYCQGAGSLNTTQAPATIPPGAVVVRTAGDVRRSRHLPEKIDDWERHLPRNDPVAQLRAELAQFHNFIRCANQIELLIRDAEIFPYKIIDLVQQEAICTITIREVGRERPGVRFLRIEGGLVEFLHRELASGKPDCNLVVLTELGQDSLALVGGERLEKRDAWAVKYIFRDSQEVVLTRAADPGSTGSPAIEGFLRGWGMFGQIALIKRRKRAIDRLQSHSYLLRSLSAPGQVYMDTGSLALPVPLSRDDVDEVKQAAIEDILRVRPIYALQGPPGTGKTTLVAHLLPQIFHDDPVAQVLITAPAHGAVDVLRSKVQEAFRGFDEEKLPLAVRIGSDARDDVNDDYMEDEGSVEEVGLQILRLAQSRLNEIPNRSELSTEWLQVIINLLAAWEARNLRTGIVDFFEIVKRGANITYCTTSAGDLEALSDTTQSFDWAIIEEAGKAHGFDLALPLQTGHRWLLIGDHIQLPPYREREYREGFAALEEVIAALESLPEIRASLLDIEWIRTVWNEMDPDERNSFKSLGLTWLKTFKRIFELCSRAPGVETLTELTSVGAAAGKLLHQHRMHPTIGNLISIAYYEGTLCNQTVDGNGDPIKSVISPFVNPRGIEGKAIVWLDTQWAARDDNWHESGPRDGHARYSNAREAQAILDFVSQLEPEVDVLEDQLEIAVLAAYSQQVALINSLSASLTLPSALKLKRVRRRRRRGTGITPPVRLAHTVDSFQGNQAEVICVSLVRNNGLPPGDGLGFLGEAPRMNVLLSRAERLLVLVGSWDFFQHQLRDVQLTDTTHPLWHWKRVLHALEDWFASGLALRHRVILNGTEERE
jgi:serine/threonine protein kinase